MSALYRELLLGLGKRLGLPDAELLPDTQEIAVDDFRVGFTYEPVDVNEPVTGDVVFFTLLGRPDPAREAAIHRLMLEGNNLWAGTGGATLGIQQNGAAVLAMSLPVESVTPEALADALADFVEVAVLWRAVVAGQAGAAQEAAAPNMLDQRA